MVSKLSYLLIFFLLASCNDFKLNLVDINSQTVELASATSAYDSISGMVVTTLTLKVLDRKGAPVAAQTPNVHLMDGGYRVDPLCAATDASGMSLCTVTTPPPSNLRKLMLNSSEGRMKFNQPNPVELWPSPIFVSVSPTVLDHDLTSQSLTLSGQYFHSGMRVFVGSVECSSVNLSSLTSLTCVLGVDAAGLKTIRLRGLDGQENSYVAAIERKDITAPSAPIANLISPSVSSSATLALTVSDCLDRPYVLVSESPLAPSSSDLGWQACTTSVGGITSTLVGPVTQGNHAIYLWAKDATGNISVSTSFSMTYDTVSPSASIGTVASILKGGASVNLSFSTSDSSGISSFLLQYAADGSTFSTIQTLAPSATSYSWTVPSSNLSGVRLRVVASDNATTANTAISMSNTFSIDSTLPSAPSVTLTAGTYTNSTTVALTAANCTDTTHILVNGGTTPTGADVGWATCTTTAGGLTTTIPSVQGGHSLNAWAKDAAGNISATATTNIVVYDSIAPVISFATTGSVKAGSSVPLNFNLTEANSDASQSISIQYSYSSSSFNSSVSAQTGPLVSEPFTWSMLTPATDGQVLTVQISFTDLAGNSSSASRTLTNDATLPIVDFFRLNNGSTTSFNNNVISELSAHDGTATLQKFCFKYNNSSAPSATDPCWKNLNAPSPGVTPAAGISFNNYFYQMGFTKATYDNYAWVMDQAGNISVNTNTLNVDHFTITFDPGTPPSISKLQVSNSDASVEPIPTSELMISNGGQLYVKWNAYDAEGLDPNPINIFYSLDDTTYLPLSGGANLTNGPNGACSVSAGFTGCALLSGPTSSYFKIRLVVKDTLQTTFFYSAALNDTKLRVIAGNTEDGLKGSANSAMFFTRAKGIDHGYIFKGMLAVSEDGKFFVNDPVRGLLWINPQNGVLDVFIRSTGVNSGNGGPISLATLKSPKRLTMDHQNNLIVWDDDQIRKVDLSTMTISAMVGGGTTIAPTTTVPASDIKVIAGSDIAATFISLPNGDLIFNEGTSTPWFRRYRAATQMVEPIHVTGSQGAYSEPTLSWSLLNYTDLGISYDSTSSAINFMMMNFSHAFVGDTHWKASRVDHTVGNATTAYPGIGPYDITFINANFHSGLDGKVYLSPRTRSTLDIYDPTTNTQTRILGVPNTFASKPCPELTLATSCEVDMDTVFISKLGRPYFIDQGLIRSVNDSGQVITLFGQFPSFGDNVLATSARFGKIQDVQFGNTSVTDDTFIVLDPFASQYREFKIGGNSKNVAESYSTWHGPYRFATNKATGEVYSPNNGALYTLNRPSNTWVLSAGGGSGPYYYDAGAEGAAGTTINFHSGYHDWILGFINGKVFYNHHSWNGSSEFACQINSYDTTDSFRQSHFMGDTTCAASYVVGNPVSSMPSSLNISNIEYVTSLGKYLYGIHGGSLYVSSPNGNLEFFKTLPWFQQSFTHTENVDGFNIYYCDGGGDLRKYNVDTDTFSHLTWSSPTVRCNPGSSLLYRASTNSLVFPARQNGLNMIVEYNLN